MFSYSKPYFQIDEGQKNWNYERLDDPCAWIKDYNNCGILECSVYRSFNSADKEQDFTLDPGDAINVLAFMQTNTTQGIQNEMLWTGPEPHTLVITAHDDEPIKLNSDGTL